LRINKYLASCGVGSRRSVEQLIIDGKVKLNGKTVSDLGTVVRIENDTVMLDGKKVEPIARQQYIVLNKPKGCICSNKDEKGRKTVFDILGDFYKDIRLFCVGRLDYDTEGLLILTTDGDLANKLMHPQFEIPKTYVLKIEGEISQVDLDKIKKGVTIDGVKTKKCRARVLEFEQGISRIEIVISEGRNRQVRKMFESINRDVIFLKRTAIGDIRLGGLYRGEYRDLKPMEIEYLKKL